MIFERVVRGMIWLLFSTLKVYFFSSELVWMLGVVFSRSCPSCKVSSLDPSRSIRWICLRSARTIVTLTL